MLLRHTSAFDIDSVTDDLLPFLARHDRIEAAFQILELGVEREQLAPYDFLLLNPHLEPLRQDPRFGEIAARSRKSFDEMLAILEEARSRGELPAYLIEPLDELQTRLGPSPS